MSAHMHCSYKLSPPQHRGEEISASCAPACVLSLYTYQLKGVSTPHVPTTCFLVPFMLLKSRGCEAWPSVRLPLVRFTVFSLLGR